MLTKAQGIGGNECCCDRGGAICRFVKLSFLCLSLSPPPMPPMPSNLDYCMGGEINHQSCHMPTAAEEFAGFSGRKHSSTLLHTQFATPIWIGRLTWNEKQNRLRKNNVQSVIRGDSGFDPQPFCLLPIDLVTFDS